MFRRFLLRSVLVAGLSLAIGCGGPDGQTRGWNQASIPLADRWISDVHADRFGDVWVVGGEPGRGAAARYDGSRWTEVLLPEGVQLLNSVHSFSDGTTFVAGDGGVILRWDGVEWSRPATPTGQNLHSIWGTGPGDMWAVGGSAGTSEGGIILRNRDGQWTTVEWPRAEHPDTRALYAVWGIGRSNVYIGGQNGTLLHWDGESVRTQESGTERDLRAIRGTGQDQIIAVGGGSQGVVVRPDGEGWQANSLQGYPGIQDIWLSGRQSGWIVGRRGLAGRLRFSAEDFTFEPVSVSTSMTLRSISGADGPGLFAVGGTFDTPEGPYNGILLRRSADAE